ncbi:uncharacterized protein [Dysidea avara]|uniref:uncharacterized protein isoform X2 n=1 Tax=Dysidea avara TaxID=196820 RepID=UPI00331F3AD2
MALPTAQIEKGNLTAFAANAVTVNFERILQKHHSDLRKSLGLEELIPLLREFDLLTKEEWDALSNKQTTQNQKIDFLVGLLPRKGEHAYTNFVTCLESEKEHPAHQELADQLRGTAAKLAESQQQIPIITYEVHSEEFKTKTDTVYDKVTEALKSGLEELNTCIQKLEERNAALEEELLVKDKRIEGLSQSDYQASPEVANFQKLMEYVNWSQNSLGKQLRMDFNTQILTEHYRCTRSILREVKRYLAQDVDRARHNIELASEESDARSRASSIDVRSRASSMESQVSKPNLALLQLRKHTVKLVEEDIKESLAVESTSSADEADDEGNIQRVSHFSESDSVPKAAAVTTYISDHEIATCSDKGAPYSKGSKSVEGAPGLASQKYPSPKLLTKVEKGSRKIPSSPSIKSPFSRQSMANSMTFDQANTKDGELSLSCEPASAPHELKEGQRVVISRSGGSECGTVKVINVSIGGKPGFVGIELDFPSGISDGILRGVRHFKTKPKHAVFVPVKNIIKIVE